MSEIKISEQIERMREFLSRVKVELEFRPDQLNTHDFLEIHWMATEMLQLEEQMKEILVQRVEEKEVGGQQTNLE